MIWDETHPKVVCLGEFHFSIFSFTPSIYCGSSFLWMVTPCMAICQQNVHPENACVLVEQLPPPKKS